MEFSHHPDTDDFSAVFSKLHSQGASDTFDVFRLKRPMSCPGVTAEVYPGATHLPLAACTSSAPAHARQTSSALRLRRWLKLYQQKETKGRERAAGSLPRSALACPLLLPYLPHSLFGNPLLAELALRQPRPTSRRASTELYGTCDFHRLSAVAPARSS